jgi:tRNA nucleotidyltransferase (CCA-adding enzyme)
VIGRGSGDSAVSGQAPDASGEALPNVARSMADAIARAGGRALVVGGWVRDRLIGRPSKDVDLEVYGLEADVLHAVLSRFGPVNTIGESFTVYKVADVDVALPRRESKTGRGHKAFEVTGDPWLPPEESARRRDFTVNAIAWDPLTGEYVDPFDGRADLLEHRRLRMVDARTFADDSLRVLRGLQMSARFELEMDAATREVCRGLPLDDLPAERVWGEVEKLILLARRPSIGLRLADDLGIVARLFPELKALDGCPQEPEWHPEGDVWVHTLMVVDQARTRIDDLPHPKRVAVMLGALCHDLGKPATTAFSDGRIRSKDHEQAGVAPARALLDRLNVHTIAGFDVRGQVEAIVADHLKPLAFFKSATTVGDGAFRRLAQKVDLELLARVAESDCLGRGGGFDCSGIGWFLERARALGVEHAAPPVLVMGRHLLALGVAPGPRMGVLLREIYEQQLDGRIQNLDDGIALARELLRRDAGTVTGSTIRERVEDRVRRP